MEISSLVYHDTGRDTLVGKRHFHSGELEILHVISGDGVMMIKDTLYPIEPNTIFFISGENVHYSAPENEKNYVRNKLVFSEEEVVNIFSLLDSYEIIEKLFMKGGSAIKLSADVSTKVDERFLRLVSLKEKNELTTSIDVMSNLFSIVSVAAKSKEKKPEVIKNKLTDVMDYLNVNIGTPMTLDDVAAANRISKYYLCHTFFENVGMTVFEYLRHIRIQEAKRKLSETAEPVSDIAFSVGFENIAYFSKVFREIEGKTPREYRKTTQRDEK